MKILRGNHGSVLVRKSGRVFNYQLQKPIGCSSPHDMVIEITVHSHMTSSAHLLQTKKFPVIYNVTWKCVQPSLLAHRSQGSYLHKCNTHWNRRMYWSFLCLSLLRLYLSSILFLCSPIVGPDLWFTIPSKLKNSAFCDHLPQFN